MTQICTRDAAVIGTLMGFGTAYNALVEDIERRGYDKGFTAFLVVGGTLVTLGGAGFLIGWRNVAKVLACFAASGFPMVVGSVGRYVRERELDQQNGRGYARELIANAEESQESLRIHR